jgi:hypothetical protein
VSTPVSGAVCRRCGHRNADGSNFCSSCGLELFARSDDTATLALDLGDLTPVTESPSEPAPDGEPAVLVVTRGPDVGSRISLGGTRMTAGRHPDSDLFLDDVTVSRRHAEIVRSPGGYEIVDVGSLNGTYVNRRRIERAALRPGDEVQIGKFKLVFQVAADGGR